ncbi:MAG: hypothetical protein AB7K09_16515 [Planctomycetota bacterium]
MSARKNQLLVVVAMAAAALVAVVVSPLLAQDEPTDPTPKPPAATPDAIATITFAAGLNRVRRAGNGRLERAAADVAIYEGDTIKVSSSGRVTLVYSPSGVYRSLGPGEELAISASQTTSEQAADMAKVNEAMVASLHSQKEGSLAAVGGTRDRRNPAEPFMLAPRNTLLLPGEPVTLRWETPDGAPAGLLYEVVVLLEGREVLRERTPTGEFPLVPAKLPALEAGRLYYWYVVRADRPTVPASKAMFRLVGAERAKQIRTLMESNEQLAQGANDLAPQFMNARLLFQESLFESALNTWLRVHEAAPGDPGLMNAIRSAWRAMGFFPDDIDRFAQALGTGNPDITPASGMISTPSVAAGTIELSWTVTTHPEVNRYRLTWWPATSGEPAEPVAASTKEVPHNPSQHTLTVRLTGLAPGRYMARVRSLGSDGVPLSFDAPENVTVEFVVR